MKQQQREEILNDEVRRLRQFATGKWVKMDLIKEKCGISEEHFTDAIMIWSEHDLLEMLEMKDGFIKFKVKEHGLIEMLETEDGIVEFRVNAR